MTRTMLMPGAAAAVGVVMAAVVLAGCSNQGETGSTASTVTTTTTVTTTEPGEPIPAGEGPAVYQARDYWPELEAAAAACSPVATADRLDRYIWATTGWRVPPTEKARAGADLPTSSTPAAGQAPNAPAGLAGGVGLAAMPEAEWNVYGHGGDPNDPKDTIAAVGRQVCDIQKRLADIAAYDELRVYGQIPQLAPGEDPKLTVATYSAVERGLNNVLGGMGADADSEFVRKVLYLR